MLKADIDIDGLINAYNPLYFYFHTSPSEVALPVYYFSDSEHRWKYGNPTSVLERPIKKIQLLIHPYSWSIPGWNNYDNFKAIIDAKQALMLQSMHDECRHFPIELLP